MDDITSPGSRTLSLSNRRWGRVVEFVEQLIDSEQVRGLCGRVFGTHSPGMGFQAGRYLPSLWDQNADDPLPVREETIFLTASLTKPVLAMGVLRLVEQGQLALNDRVVDFLPEYHAADRKRTTILQLLTHTSGLPDMLPNNRSLRERQSPLSAFVEGTCAVTLDYPPGRGVQYQSMGYALLGEIVQRISGLPLAEALQESLFRPLQMWETSLGIPEGWSSGEFPPLARVIPVELPEDQQGGDDWNWNSVYWSRFGAPWGGLYSTTGDLVRFLQMMMNRGTLEGTGLFSPCMVAQAIDNQLIHQRDIPETERRSRGWGLGWRLNWKDHAACFCDLASPESFGHFGATGTLMFVDPRVQAGVVILSTRPLERGENWLTRLANLMFAAIES